MSNANRIVGRSGKTDTRIVWGVGCCWWDSVDKASKNISGLPCCPHCGSMLMEVPSPIVWWTNVDDYAKKANDRDYREFMKWLRGKCFRSIVTARAEFERVRPRSRA